jgi:integrase
MELYIFDILDTMGTRTVVESLTPVKSFLDSKCRNSIDSRNAYLTGLVHFDNFMSPENYTIESVLTALAEGQLNVYELLDSFISSQISKLSPRTTRLNLAVMKSYFGYHDIDIIPSRFQKKVTVPKIHKEKEQPIDASDIRNILLVCNVKTCVLILASGGMRAVEALAIKIGDIDYSVSPTKIHIRKEYAKIRVARDIYISDEATQYLKSWIDWKYRNGRLKTKDDLVFGVLGWNPRTLLILSFNYSYFTWFLHFLHNDSVLVSIYIRIYWPAVIFSGSRKLCGISMLCDL